MSPLDRLGFSSVCSVWLGAALGLMACGSDDGTPAAGGELRTGQQACSARCGLLLEVGCPDVAGKSQAECETSCLQVFEFFPACQSQFLAVANCAGIQAASGWECAGTGESVIAAGVCTAQTASLTQCLSDS